MRGTPLLVKVLAVCLVLGQPAFGADDHDHDHPEGGKKGAKPPAQQQQGNRSRPAGGFEAPHSHAHEEGCTVNPAGIADFANGERYDYGNMVTFLSSPACAVAARQVSLAALSSGVTFSDKAPYRLDGFAQALPRTDLESAKRMEMALARTIPGLMRSNPLSSTEMLPILGQLAILSQDAARSTLATVITQEIYAGESRLSLEGKVGGRDLAAADLARTLVRLGANESAIATELAGNIEEMALMAQADSLTRLFRGLSAAASADALLVPTFNLTAGAFNRGVQRGKKLYLGNDKAAMLATVFSSIRAAMGGAGSLEPGAAELNEAFGALMGGEALTATKLKTLWKQAIRVLTQTTTQTAIADAIALSLTPQVIFLLPEELEQLLLAARNYPQVAGSLQTSFLAAWNKVWNDLQDQRIKVSMFNRMRERYFEPLVAEILDLDPYLIDAGFLKEVTRRNLVQDEDIEKRFPRFVLAYLERRERASKAAAVETGPEPVLASMAESFAVLYTLNSVHVPALMKWVKKYEQ